MSITAHPNGNGRYKEVSNEPIITTTAKDFLKDPNASSAYLMAVRATIDAIMAAIYQRLEKAARDTAKQ